MALLTDGTDELLFHYTSVEALLGMLGSEAIWLSDVRFQNDASLFDQARASTGRLIDELACDLSDKSRRVLKQAAGRQFDDCWCAFSLSTEGDLLSQWRGYTPVAEGGGLALGFARNELAEASEASGFHLVECVYDAENPMALLRPIVERWISAFRDAQGACDDEAFDWRSWDGHGDFHREWLDVAVSIKHPAFAEERESRIAGRVPIKDVRYRASGGRIVPYKALRIEFHGSASPLRRIVLGPGASQGLNYQSLRLVLSTHRLEHVERTTASTPLRR